MGVDRAYRGRITKEALRHAGMARYGPTRTAPIRVLIQGFGDVGGFGGPHTEESPDFVFRIVGVADEFGALYRASGLDVPMLLGPRAARRPMVEYSGIVDALWVATPSEVDRARPGFRGTDAGSCSSRRRTSSSRRRSRTLSTAVAPRLRVRLVAEGANNAGTPGNNSCTAGAFVPARPGAQLGREGLHAGSAVPRIDQAPRRSHGLRSRSAPRSPRWALAWTCHGRWSCYAPACWGHRWICHKRVLRLSHPGRPGTEQYPLADARVGGVALRTTTLELVRGLARACGC